MKDSQPQSPDAQSNVPQQKPEGDKSPIPLNEYGFPPSLIPLQKYPFYDSYGNFPLLPQYPVLAPNYYPQQDFQLPPIDQPMFTVGARNFQQPEREDKSLPNENLLPAVTSDAIKNNGNRNSDIPDVEIPPIPFTIKKN